MAMAFPEAEEGTSCNKAAFKAGKKSYLFMGMNEKNYNLAEHLLSLLSTTSSLDDKEEYEATLSRHRDLTSRNDIVQVWHLVDAVYEGVQFDAGGRSDAGL